MHRYFPATNDDVKKMLKKVNLKSLDDLFKDVPEKVKFKGEIDIPHSMSEQELVAHLNELASKNKNLISLRGDGAYDHFTPLVIDSLISRQEFYTAYTPYQPEIAQGTLQYIFEFQSMICNLTGMDVTNASMYDGATSTAEAMFMAVSATKRNKILIASTVAERIRNVVKTYAKFRDIEVVEVSEDNGVVSIKDLKAKLDDSIAGIIVQNPSRLGIVEDFTPLSEIVHANESLVIGYVDPFSLAILKNPRQMGVDIAVGDGQSLGVPLSFGGPYVGFLATVDKLLRKLPGRIVGMSNDADGKRAYVLTLQAREQHIRREKANSNICSNQSLMALYVTLYLSLMGKQGFKEVATRSHKGAQYLATELEKTGKFKLAYNKPFFNEFAMKTSLDIDKLNQVLSKHGYLGGSKTKEGYYLLYVSEKLTKAQLDEVVSLVGGV